MSPAFFRLDQEESVGSQLLVLEFQFGLEAFVDFLFLEVDMVLQAVELVVQREVFLVSMGEPADDEHQASDGAKGQEGEDGDIEVPAEQLVFADSQVPFQQLFGGLDLVDVEIGLDPVDVPFVFYTENGVVQDLFFAKVVIGCLVVAGLIMVLS